MSHFYGTLYGNGNAVTRQGTKQSGIYASVQSWNGSITVSLSEIGDVTYAELQVLSSSSSGGRTLYYGPLSDLVESDKVIPLY